MNKQDFIKMVRFMRERQNMTYQDITNYLNSRDIRTPDQNKKWTSHNLYRFLKAKKGVPV